MQDFKNEQLMSETAEERAIRLYTAAERMKNVRKESEEQAAIRRMQEAQRMARHRAKKKRCLDENLAREISKIADLSKNCPDAVTIAHMSELNMNNKLSVDLKTMMERGKVPEHIIQLAQYAEYNKASQDMAKRYELEKIAATEYMKMQELMKINDMMSQMKKMNDVQRINDISKLKLNNDITITKLNDPPQPPPPKVHEVPMRIPEPVITVPNPRNLQNITVQVAQASPSNTINFPSVPGQGKYAQLLVIIEELGRDIRLSYSGSRNAQERLKMGIQHARLLTRECLLETEHNARQ